MASSCPISSERVDANAIRLSALFMFLLLLWGYVSVLALLVIIMELAIRVFMGSLYAPLFVVAKKILKFFKIDEVKEDAAAKKFAARVGLILMIFLLLAKLMGWELVGEILYGIMAVCIALEAFFHYCVGCTLYNYYIRGVQLCRK
ncbi:MULTISPECIES: DUF4395 domain-containing protein [unclassified Nitratiruptor]|uniref:DUF4395 domain-containing protein n=1 Tax=unclassified Nitratiruptor TaxID=2624044 RepID=UPI0019169801|nr:MULTISPECIES: DUF4395 domain-containing protein [unclassified Nitratiruptor]